MITNYLIEKSNGLLIKSPEDTDIRYSKFNTSGVECEVGEFLYAMVRILKPQFIVETGTAKGISSAYMGLALKENGDGHLRTYEFDKSHYVEAEILWKNLEIDKFISLWKMKVFDTLNWNGENWDMLFLDTEPSIRFQELVRLYPHVKPGGYIFIHDLPPTFCKGNVNPDHPEFKDWPFGPVPEEMKNWIKDDELRPFSFPTPRGLMGFYRTKEDDYRA